MRRLARAFCIAVLAAVWSVPAGATTEPDQARQRGSRPTQAQRAPQRAPQRAAPPRRMTQPRRAAGGGRTTAQRAPARRAAPRASGPARAGAQSPRSAGRAAPDRAAGRVRSAAPRSTPRVVPERTTPRRRVGEPATGGGGRTQTAVRTPDRRIGQTTPRAGGRAAGTTPRDGGRTGAVRRAPDRRAGGTAPRVGDGGTRNGAATRVAPTDTARRGARPRRTPDAGVVGNGRRGVARPVGATGIGVADAGRRAGRAAVRPSDGRGGRGGAAVVDRRGPRGNAVRRADAPLASRPIVVNNYVDGGRRGYRGYRRYGGRHHYGIPHILGSYFYFPGYSTFSLGVAVGSGLHYPDPYWNPYWYGYYGHGYGYTAWGGGTFDYTGSLRLKVQPRSAEVYVDGYYAGLVDSYDGIFQRLRLEEGAHHIEIRHPGYEPIAFEVRILPGETITYEGFLQPL